MKLKIAIYFLVIIATFVLLTLWRAGQRERAAQAAFPPQGSFVTVDGLRVHAVVEGSGPDLVLIHGLSGNLRDFTFDAVGALSGRYRVIALDRPGLGYSDPLPLGADGLEQQARHLAKAARALGAGRPLVLGHSYGGAVALAWAVHQPDHIAALIAVSGPSHPVSVPIPAFYRISSYPAGAALLSAWVPSGVVERSVAETFLPQPAPPGYAGHLGAGLTLRRATLAANASHRLQVFDDLTAMVPHYPRLRLPIELLHGDADGTVSIDLHARVLVTEVPGAVLTVLPGIGHATQHVALAPMIEAIDRAAARAGLR